MQALEAEKKQDPGVAPAGKKDALTVIDQRTGKSYELPIADGTIRAIDLRKIKTDPQDFGLMTYDPAFMNTASCRSRITFIDGDKGILRYRGYPIEQLAEESSYLEVAYLLLNGELPTKEQLDQWAKRIDLWHNGREPSDARLVAKKRADRKSGRLVFTYFDNSIKVHAPRDAICLARRLHVS
jgi:hypothetical protein